ncbi:MAG: hypothetical protein HN420_09970 [Rhodospirillaceae bacterium]|nr:hypothetical protein [Rhodospirillaceae bacterium]
MIDEASKACWEARNIAGRTIKGDNFKTRRRVEVPQVQFATRGGGSEPVKTRQIVVAGEVFLINPHWQLPWTMPQDEEELAAALADEAVGTVEGALQTLCRQFYYGRQSDKLGYPGLFEAVDESMILDAKGTAGGDIVTSVWALRFGREGVGWVYGRDGEFIITDPRKETIIPDPEEPTKTCTGVRQELIVRPGLEVRSTYSAACLMNLTDEEGCGLTDDFLQDLWTTFPAGKKPDAFLCNKTAIGQLWTSRRLANSDGKASRPDNFEGIPIQETDSILNSEAIGGGLPDPA